MSDLIKNFDPSAATSGSFVVTYLSNGIGKLVLWNDSAWSLDLTFPNGDTNIAPAWCAMIYELTGPAGSVLWAQDKQVNLTTPDLSNVWVVAYRDNEILPGVYPIALTRQAKQGGGVSSVTVTSGNINIGNVTGTVAVSGTITVSAINSSVTVTGAVTVSGSVTVSNSLTIGSITNAVTITGAITVSNALTIGTVSTTVPIETSGSSVVNVGTVAGTVNVAGSVNITNSSINIGTVTGNVTVVGTINVGTMPAITIAAAQSVNIGTIPAINIAAAQSINIGTMPAILIAAAQSVNIGNTPAVTISGTPTVNIAAAQSVNISNTPAVTISGTPSVSISGTPSVTITSGSIVISSGSVSVNGSQVNSTGNINAGHPIFSVTVGSSNTSHFAQKLNVFNPAASGKTLTFYSARVYTSSANSGNICYFAYESGADLALPLALSAVSHTLTSSPPLSVTNCTYLDDNTLIAGTTVIEELDTKSGVTLDFLDFPDIVTLAPGGNLLITMQDSIIAGGHSVRLTLKWSEA